MRHVLLLVLALASIVANSRAELPPQVYERDQARSPEVLTIKVESARVVKHKEAWGIRTEITARARVQEVKRSASHLHVGDLIRIEYSHSRHTQPMTGPSEPDILEQGRTYPAFLRRSAKTGAYALAARGYSFRSLR